MSDTTGSRAVRAPTAPNAASTLPTPTRNEYWHGKSMGVEEFVRDQQYHRTIQQTLTRLTVGCGVLCGLSVARHGAAGAAISPGAAVDGDGHLIIVARAITLDHLGRWICPADDRQPTLPGHYRLCLIHHECPVAPAPVLVTDCDTRVECRPGAVEERYRLEARLAERSECDDPCPACSHRSTGRGSCRCGDGQRSCESECDDCVAIAWFRWNGREVTDLWMDGRTEIPSIRELARRTAATDAIVGPRLVGMWPNPGQRLERTGTPSEWGRWRYRPRLEFCFDQPVDWDRVDDPADWLRAWAVVRRASSAGSDASELNVRRITLRALPGATTTTDDGQTIVYAMESDRATEAIDAAVAQGFAVIVQARASADTGPTGAGAVSRTAQIEFSGTALTVPQLDRLWDANQLSDDVDFDSLIAATPPDCFGDGYDGGRLHAAFRIAPVDATVVATGLAPHNGARVRAEALPSVEISSNREMAGRGPRGWLITADNRRIELNVGAGGSLDNGTDAGARERYESALDATLDASLAHTRVLPIQLPPGVTAGGGRVLMITPAGDPNQLGSFAGTCLSEAEVAQVYEHGLDPEHLAHVRPSSARMPQAGASGSWLHWTFAWEQTNANIR